MELPKPYYETELGKLYHGDCLEILPHLEPVDLVLTDIPYGEVNRKGNGLRNLDKGKADIETFQLKEFIPIIAEISSGSIYIFCGTEQISKLRHDLIIFNYSTRLCIWEKKNPSPMNGEHIWISGLECCVFGKRAGATFNEFCKVPIWKFCTEKDQIHETQKPVHLFSYLISVSSN
jgi:site-specific DNA-methyltransferase (adenine-specific)